jgi:two-component system chemotaxis response regulator CheB
MAKDSLNRYRVVAIGGSAGSLEVILNNVGAFPALEDVFYVIILHRKNTSDSILVNLMSARTKMLVREVEDKEPILPSTIYLAPPDYHLLLEDSHSFSLDTSEKVHFSRPSIDISFESVAAVFGASAIGVLLSGANADGAEGLEKIRKCGGYTIVQDPATAEVSFMPQQAINRMAAEAVVPAEEIGQYIRSLLIQ